MRRYSKALAALAGGAAAAALLLPVDAPKWLLTTGMIITSVVSVIRAPKNKPA